ncbi:MAG: hypothetical protein R3248_08005 [Candidatus Promineifilaceae bacterium]|nr:hypothetical protein [Candidatus Promineifilaceae bacterium]
MDLQTAAGHVSGHGRPAIHFYMLHDGTDTERERSYQTGRAEEVGWSGDGAGIDGGTAVV